MNQALQNDGVKAAAAALAPLIQQQLDMLDARLGLSFRVSRCNSLVGELTQALLPRNSNAATQMQVHEAVKLAVDLALESNCEMDEHDNLPKAVVIGGVQYRREQDQKPLGKGSYGSTYLFRSDSGRECVLKFSNDSSEAAFDDMAAEIVAHYTATHGSRASELAHGAIPFLGAVRMPGRRIAIAMDYAPHGGLDHVGKMIFDSMPGVGDPDDNVVRRALARDCLRAWKSMREAGVFHGDVKPQNFLIDKDGFARLGDFGTGALSRRRNWHLGKLGLKRGVGNPLYRHRSLGSALDILQQQSIELTRKFKPRVDRAQGKRKHALQDKWDAERSALETSTDALSADAWSMGALLFELVTGKAPFETRRFDEVENAQGEFLQIKDREVCRAKLGKDFQSVTRDLQDLILELLMQDGSHVPDPASLLELEMFKDPELDALDRYGDCPVRERIKGLANMVDQDSLPFR